MGYLAGAGVLDELSDDDELGFEASLPELESFEAESLDELESFEAESLDELDSVSLEASLGAEPFDRPELRLSFL
jgi:hypothetical protein